MLREALRVDTTVVLARIDALKSSFPELADDAELLAGMIEGETDFDRVLDKLADAFLDAQGMRDVAELRAASLRDRAHRYEAKASAVRTMILDLMKSAGQTTYRLPIATISVRKPVPRVVVDDVDRLPQGLVRIERKPALSAISAALEAGDDLDGIAHFETGPEGLAIRVK